MATFVLVHGAWHGGWCWKEKIRLTGALERIARRTFVLAADYNPSAFQGIWSSSTGPSSPLRATNDPTHDSGESLQRTAVHNEETR